MTRLCALLLLLAGVCGCYQKMAIQPSYRPQDPSDFFADGLSTRPPVPGTVARGQLDVRINTALYQGKDDKGALTSEVPFEVTAEVMKRGQERFGVYCSMCHGPTGAGDGRIVQRGFTPPPKLWEDSRAYALRGEKVSLTDVPVGHIYDVINRGHGAMPAYAAQIKVHDRWAIVAYVRALQYSGSTEMRQKMGKEKAK